MTVFLKNSAGEIINQWPTQAAAAVEYGNTSTTISRWIKKGVVDRLFWSEIKPDTSKCSKCSTVLTPGNKASDRNQCNECVNKKNQKFIEMKKLKIVENEKNGIERVCETCELPGKTYKSAGHKHCEGCSVKTPVISQEEFLENTKVTERKCNLCEETKDISDFAWHFNNFRNQCKTCRDGFRTWEQSRNNKIKRLGKEAVNKHNAAVHLEWTKNNPEYVEYVKYYKKSIASICCDYYCKSDKSMEKKKFKEMISSVVIQDCIYCGRKSTFENTDKGTLGDYNTVDRINSDIGYVIGNVVPACYTCNMMKNSMDIASFVRKCVEIAKFNKLVDISEIFDIRLKYHSDTRLIGTSGGYSKYKSGSIIRKKKFDISKKFFNELISKSCHYCGCSGELGIGVDRFDNNIGYTEENCVACCNYCNYMKRSSEYSKFLDCIKKIVIYTNESRKIKELCNVANFAAILGSQCNPYDNEIVDIYEI